jgi:DNA-binding NtrC family response regulator
MGRDGSKILVIADDPTLHKLVRILLADKGFQLTSTSGVEEALEAVRRWRPHLAILSLALRELTLFRTLRQMDPGLEVIVISHQAD